MVPVFVRYCKVDRFQQGSIYYMLLVKDPVRMKNISIAI